MNLSGLSVKRPVTTVMLVLIVVLFGLVSFTRIPIDLYPNIEVPVAIVSTSYANVAPEEIENLITRPLEEAVGTVANLDSIQSITTEGQSIIVVMFEFGTDMDFAALEMRESVDMVSGFLPADATDPMVMQIDINAEAIVQLSLSGSDVSTLQRYADEEMKSALERIEGVASVDIGGGYDNYISIQVDTEKLNGYGLSIDTLAGILASENINLPAGSVSKGDTGLLIRTVGEFESLEDIEQTPITMATGGIIKLSDIAEVSVANRDQNSISTVNGEEAVTISIQKQSGVNTVAVANEINKVVEELSGSSPYEIKVIVDQSDFINQAIGQVGQNGIIGGLLAVLILLLFLRSFRSTLIIGLSIPISIIATMVLIYFSDITLNMMTLGGLSLGIGMLVDNSVVVLENIYRFVQEGMDKRKAAVKGAQEVAMAVTASTLTTVAVFLPMVFVEGITSIMFREFSLTVTFSLLSSLVVSLTLVPMMSSQLLVVDEFQGKHHENKFRLVGWVLDKFDQFFTSIESGYRKLLHWSLHHRKTVVVAAVFIFIISLLSTMLIGMEFMPASDEGTFSISVELEPSAKMEDTSAALETIVERIIDIEEIDYVSTTTAGNMFLSSGANSGTINGVLIPMDQRGPIEETVLEIEDRIQGIPGVISQVTATSSMGMMMGGGSPISIEIKGDDMDTLKEVSDMIAEAAKDVDGAKNVTTSLDDPIPQYEIRLRRNDASRYGLTTAQISSAVKAMLDGRTATRYKLDGVELDVVIQGDSRYEESVENLKQLMIQAPTGALVPLELVADITTETGAITINRIDQSRYVTVSSDVSGRDLAAVVADIEEKVDELDIPRGYTIEFSGQNQEMIEAFSDLGLALILAVLLVYMIIASQFESLLLPFIIMMSAPLAYSGGLLGLFMTNRTLNITSIIGFIMLSGIVVNNAIVLIDYIQTRRQDYNEDRETAILNAGPIRLRPILMTSLTTILALVPLSLGIGEGAEIQASMGTVVIFGLILSSLLTLVFIPVVYTIFDNMSQKSKAKRHGTDQETIEAKSDDL